MNRHEIEKRLKKLDKKKKNLFAYRCALRVFPIIGYQGNFDFWKENKRKIHIVSLFRALDSSKFYFLNIDRIFNSSAADTAAAAADAAYAAAYADAAAAAAAADAAYAAAYADAAAAAADAAYAAAYADAAADAIKININIENEILLDLEKLEKNIDISNVPLWNKMPKEFNKVLLNFEKALKDLNFNYWWKVYKEHFENRINQKHLKRRINVPQEIVKRGGDNITNYLLGLEKLKKQDISFLKEVKVHFVGNGGSGKTCLKALIKGEKFKETNTTTGVEYGDKKDIVDIDTEKLGKVKTYLWDFGGQEKMWPVHTFFFSSRSIYLLVLDSRKEEDAEHWLEMIDSYAKKCAILIVLNKQDQHPSFDLDRAFLKNKYPNIIGFYQISCKKRDKYKNEIKIFDTDFRKTLENAGHTLSEISKAWIKLKNDIPETLKNKDFISKDEYFDLCEKYNIEKNERITLIKLLNDLGILLYYPEKELSSTEVINPQWVTTAVYGFLHDKKIIENQGYFNDKDFNRVLDNIKEYKYPYAHRPYIVYIMERFFVAYKIIQKKGKYVIPVLLKDKSPEINEIPFKKENAIQARIKYTDFFPKNIIPQFICLTHTDIFDNKVWKTGVLLKDNKSNTYALGQSDTKKKVIDIWACGNDPRGYLSYIRKIFSNQIHSEIKNLKTSELVPLPDKTETGTTRWVEYEELVGLLTMKEFKYSNGRLKKTYSIQTLLEGIETREETQKQMGNIQVSPHINVNTKTQVENEINISNKIKTEFDNFTGNFNYLKGKLIEKNPDLEKELESYSRQINKIDSTKEKDEIIKTGILHHIRDFINNIGDENSNIGKTLKGLGKFSQTVAKLGLGWEKIKAFFC